MARAGGRLIFAGVAVDAARGALLAHGQVVGTARWSKGRRISDADIAAARAAGLTELTVARLDADDVAEADAAARLGAALAGAGVTALPPAHGRVNLAAAAAGLLLVEPHAVDRLNGVDEAVTLGTLMPFARVAAGDIVATIKIIPYAVPGATLAAALAAAVPLSVAAFRVVTIDLIHTLLPGQTAKVQAKTERVTRARLAALGARIGNVATCDHDAAALSAALHATTADIVLVTGASATVDRCDVVPAAVELAGGRIERLGMPVDPGNLLCLGAIGERAVIGLPGCARSPKRNGFDWVLERLVAGVGVSAADIAGMGVGGLLPEAERPQPRLARDAGGVVGAVILAAGRSTRMGGPSKLVADLHGQAVVAHVVASVAAAGLPRPIVVVGDRAAAVRAALAGYAADFVEAADFADGLSASLRAGIAAIPAGWRGAVVLLGDMPRVTSTTLRALAAAATETAIAVPVWAGKRGNPVLWGAAYFAELRTLNGDVGGKALLSEHADRIVEVAADSDGVLIDVDTPEALAALRG